MKTGFSTTLMILGALLISGTVCGEESVFGPPEDCPRTFTLECLKNGTLLVFPSDDGLPFEVQPVLDGKTGAPVINRKTGAPLLTDSRFGDVYLEVAPTASSPTHFEYSVSGAGFKGVSADLFYGVIEGADGDSYDFLDWTSTRDLPDPKDDPFSIYDQTR